MRSKILTNSIVFTGMTILQKGLAFFLLPLYTYLLSPEQYGMFNVVSSISAVYVLLFSFALDDAVARFYFQYRNDQDKVKVVVGTLSAISLFISFVGVLLIGILNKIFLVPFAANISFFPYIFLGLIPVLCSSIYGIVQKILIIEEKAVHYSINTFVFFLVNTALCIFLIVYCKLGAQGLLLASSITYIIFFVYCLIYLYPKISFDFDKKIAIMGLKYGLVLLPNRIASWGLSYLNKIVVGNIVSISMVGIYNIAETLTSIILIGVNSISFVLQPWVYKQLEKEDGQENILIVSDALSIVFCLIGLGVSLFSKDIINIIINDRYFEAVKVIPVLAWGITTAAYSSLFVYVLFYYESQTKYVSISTIAGAAVNIILSLMLTPIFGIIGSAISVSIANFTICIIKSYYANKCLSININIVKMHFTAILALLISLICLYQSYSFIVRVLVFICFTLITLIVSYESFKNFSDIARN